MNGILGPHKLFAFQIIKWPLGDEYEKIVIPRGGFSVVHYFNLA